MPCVPFRVLQVEHDGAATLGAQEGGGIAGTGSTEAVLLVPPGTAAVAAQAAVAAAAGRGAMAAPAGVRRAVESEQVRLQGRGLGGDGGGVGGGGGGVGGSRGGGDALGFGAGAQAAGGGQVAQGEEAGGELSEDSCGGTVGALMEGEQGAAAEVAAAAALEAARRSRRSVMEWDDRGACGRAVAGVDSGEEGREVGSVSVGSGVSSRGAACGCVGAPRRHSNAAEGGVRRAPRGREGAAGGAGAGAGARAAGAAVLAGGVGGVGAGGAAGAGGGSGRRRRRSSMVWEVLRRVLPHRLRGYEDRQQLQQHGQQQQQLLLGSRAPAEGARGRKYGSWGEHGGGREGRAGMGAVAGPGAGVVAGAGAGGARARRHSAYPAVPMLPPVSDRTSGSQFGEIEW